jgi:hypothetical protein
LIFKNNNKIKVDKMQFMNANVQSLFFEAHRLRRRNRDKVAVEAPVEHRLMLDDSLDLIICHHPDIWSYGTGVLLVAPLNEKRTKSAKRAMDMRNEARTEHSYIRYVVQYEHEHIGFFIRKTIEFRDRIRLYSYNSELAGEMISFEIEEMIEYVENNILYELETFSNQSERSRIVGIKNFGIDYHRSVTKYLQDYQILNQIQDVYQNERVFNPLRNVLLDIFPNALDNEPVARELSFEDDDILSEISEYTIFVDVIPELVHSQGECIVCYTDGDVLEWPCHSSHIICQTCTEKIIANGALCPICRRHILLPD